MYKVYVAVDNFNSRWGCFEKWMEDWNPCFFFLLSGNK